ncbi:hypothetical protein [Novosphingobium sp. ST904]|uniref:hypothetical protein n=1 Tax=Novosphingobium sp. ST904 TaxID=1684385 RepID=UPI0006C8C5DC|nr:hypothetical protein [Novosphingobium sp. ST904]KPH59197.1 hypothetical protein ADT71_23950 [Novosphingobium sp. ST904]TCM37714.1 hypothetical protein EDF59_110110 [Novosphingobium sp. ST904]
MPRVTLSIARLLRSNQQLAIANAGKAAAETAKVAEETQSLIDLTLGLDVDGTRQSIASIERRLDQLEEP